MRSYTFEKEKSIIRVLQDVTNNFHKVIDWPTVISACDILNQADITNAQNGKWVKNTLMSFIRSRVSKYPYMEVVPVTRVYKRRGKTYNRAIVCDPKPNTAKNPDMAERIINHDKIPADLKLQLLKEFCL